MTLSRRQVIILVAVMLGVAVWALRTLTMAAYRPTPPGSRTAVGFEVVTSGTPSSDLANARALLWPCVADLDSELVGDISSRDGRFHAVLEPALDRARIKKFLGCLSDLRVAHTRAAAVEIERVQ